LAEGFEEVELTSPKEALEEAGRRRQLCRLPEKKVNAWDETDWGKKFKVDVPLNEARADDEPKTGGPGVVQPEDDRRIWRRHSSAAWGAATGDG
jgi:protease I